MDTGKQHYPIDAGIAQIKDHMPETYAAIKTKAEEVGKSAFAQVRRGLRGEANCFYAFERGRVVGTAFSGEHAGLMEATAMAMVQFGVQHVSMWGPIDGTN